jgi:hexosaminidase
MSAHVFAAEKNVKPFVIPELREWKGATGEFTITEATKVVYPAKQQELAEVAKLFAQDYKKMFGTELQVVEGKAAKGDIQLSLKNNKKIGTGTFAFSSPS